MNNSKKRIKLADLDLLDLIEEKLQMTDLSDKESAKIVGGGVPGRGGIYIQSCYFISPGRIKSSY